MNIKTRIVNSIIEQKFVDDGYEVIDSVNEISKVANKVVMDEHGNVVFGKSHLVSIFMAELRYLNNNITFINCDATIDRLKNDMDNATGDMLVYYNVGKCNYTELLGNIVNNQSILCL